MNLPLLTLAMGKYLDKLSSLVLVRQFTLLVRSDFNQKIFHRQRRYEFKFQILYFRYSLFPMCPSSLLNWISVFLFNRIKWAFTENFQASKKNNNIFSRLQKMKTLKIVFCVNNTTSNRTPRMFSWTFINFWFLTISLFDVILLFIATIKKMNRMYLLWSVEIPLVGQGSN